MKGVRLVSLLLDVATPDGTCRVEWSPEQAGKETWAGVRVTVLDGPQTHAASTAVAAVTQKIVPAARMLGVL